MPVTSLTCCTVPASGSAQITARSSEAKQQDGFPLTSHRATVVILCGLAADLSRVVQKIEEGLAENVTLSQLAAVAGLSVPHFCRAFKRSFGCPPYEFIIRRRIERAKEHLRHSEMTITDIALACGFSTSSHFANSFRRQVGTTPQMYRAAWSDRAFG